MMHGEFFNAPFQSFHPFLPKQDHFVSQQRIMRETSFHDCIYVYFIVYTERYNS